MKTLSRQWKRRLNRDNEFNKDKQELSFSRGYYDRENRQDENNTTNIIATRIISKSTNYPLKRSLKEERERSTKFILGSTEDDDDASERKKKSSSKVLRNLNVSFHNEGSVAVSQANVALHSSADRSLLQTRAATDVKIDNERQRRLPSDSSLSFKRDETANISHEQSSAPLAAEDSVRDNDSSFADGDSSALYLSAIAPAQEESFIVIDSTIQSLKTDTNARSGSLVQSSTRMSLSKIDACGDESMPLPLVGDLDGANASTRLSESFITAVEPSYTSLMLARENPCDRVVPAAAANAYCADSVERDDIDEIVGSERVIDDDDDDAVKMGEVSPFYQCLDDVASKGEENTEFVVVKAEAFVDGVVEQCAVEANAIVFPCCQSAIEEPTEIFADATSVHKGMQTSEEDAFSSLVRAFLEWMAGDGVFCCIGRMA